MASVANWPISGYFQDTSTGEWFAYTITSQSGKNNVSITGRCLFGSNPENTSDSDPLDPVPPVVLAVFPGAGPNGQTAVWTNATASTVGGSITGISWSSGTVTVTVPSTAQLASGDTIAIAGCAPGGYNGTYTITVTSATQFTYTLASDPGTATVFGTYVESGAITRTVQFLNYSGNLSSGSLGFIVANFGYHIWTANTAAGPAPDGVLTTCPPSPGCTTGSHHTITLGGEDAGNWYKLFAGMSVSDLTNPANIPEPCTISTTPMTAVIHVTGSCTALSFSGDQIQFSGCGYTSGSPQLGNCVATSLLCGGSSAGSEVQGLVVDWFHPYGNRIATQANNCPALSMSDTVIDGGGGVGDQLDPYSAAFWCQGKCTKDNIGIGRLGGSSIAILDNSSQASALTVSNMQISGNIVVNNSSQFTASSLSGSSNIPQIIFASQGASTTLSGNSLPEWSVAIDIPTATQNLFCSGNQFSTLLCSTPLPTLVENLPACNASWLGQPLIPVTDAASDSEGDAPTWLGTLYGGGATAMAYVHALCNGTNWVAE